MRIPVKELTLRQESPAPISLSSEDTKDCRKRQMASGHEELSDSTLFNANTAPFTTHTQTRACNRITAVLAASSVSSSENGH